MLCGGVTAYAPLIENGAGPGKRVGIVGVGGLGHFGILWAKALGCSEIVAISRSSAKKADALKMGATDFIATGEDEKWARKNRLRLDLIVCTVSSHDMPLAAYLGLLAIKGTMIQIGAPDENIPAFNAFSLLAKGVKLGGSAIGSPAQIRDMLKLAEEKKVRPWIQTIPMKDATRAVMEFEQGKPRYRFVLVNEDKEKI